MAASSMFAHTDSNAPLLEIFISVVLRYAEMELVDGIDDEVLAPEVSGSCNFVNRRLMLWVHGTTLLNTSWI